LKIPCTLTIDDEFHQITILPQLRRSIRSE